MDIKKYFSGIGWLFLFLSVMATDLLADSSEINSKNNPDSEISVESIMVTARKREEDPMKIPGSMKIFSDSEIEDADIEDIKDITRYTPNVYMKKGSAESTIVFRGISGFDTTIHSPAGLYIDDINLPLNYMQNPVIYDIERVEVLRGPQGTLYGRNSESGVINIVTKQPDNDFRLKAFGEYKFFDGENGRTPGWAAGGSISCPIVKDKFFIGAAGEFEKTDGFIENSFTGCEEDGKVDSKNARATLRWTPSGRLDISLIADIVDSENGNGAKRYLEGPKKTGRHEITYNEDGFINQEGNGETLRIKYKGELFNLLSVSGKRYFENHMVRDSDCSPSNFGINDLIYENDIISQEVRISSPEKTNIFDWLFGVYGFKEENNMDIDLQGFGERRKTDLEYIGYAFFGEGTLHLFDRLHFTAGLRYDYTDMEGGQEVLRMKMNSKSFFEKSFDNTEVLPKISVSYDISENIMTYGSAAKGFLAGGYNTAFAEGVETFTYEPEHTWNYEIGLKSSFLNGRVKSNIALFYIDIDDKQVTEIFSDPEKIVDVLKVRNAAEAHSMGAEVEVQARLMTGLDLFAGYGYTEVSFDDWTAYERNKMTNQLVKYDYKDKELPNAPNHNSNLGLQYRHSSGLFTRGDIIKTGSFFSDAKNNVKIDSYTLVNVRAGYESEHYDIIFWCKNLFDEEYETVKFDRRFDSGIDGDPRSFGVKVVYRF